MKQLLRDGVISMDYVNSESNLADPLTKGLSRQIVTETERYGVEALP